MMDLDHCCPHVRQLEARIIVTTATAPVFPPGRYGRRREPRRNRRWLTYLLLVPVLVAGTWLALRLYHQYGDSTYQPIVSDFTVVNDHRVDVQLEVSKANAKPAVCRLQAQDSNAGEVGYAEVPVPEGSDVHVGYSLTTNARAFVVTVLGCNAG
jgi:hypothetical protein